MNDEEIRSVLEQIKAQVKAKPENKEKTEDEIDEMILDSFFKAYTEGKMTKEDLGGLAQAMGYEFTEDFNADAPDNFAEGEGETKVPAGSEEALEEVRTIEPGEDVEEFKEKVEDVKEGDDVEVKEEDEEDEEGDEAEERKKASELWKMNLNK